MIDEPIIVRKVTQKERTLFQKSLLLWYREHGRDLPWRRTNDPYHVLVSELMLQQTQVDRVIPKYYAFLEAFPSVGALARAEQGDVLRKWAGLGYNSRAMRLHQLAKVVMESHDGRIPDSQEELKRLPGIGDYTSGAVRTFGYRLPSVFYDVNIVRILQRVFLGPDRLEGMAGARMISGLAEELAPQDSESYDYHQSLMDIGARFCGARQASCSECPLRGQCKTRVLLESEPLLLKQIAAKKATKKKKEPFHLSNRYLRGRIVDALRAHGEGRAEIEIYRILHKQEVPLLERLPEILQTLLNEGLIQKSEDIYRL